MTQLKPAVNSNDHMDGDINSPLELVEYGDYECPYCGRAYPIIKVIQEKLGPRLRFIFRNFPLSKSHPHAFTAAVAAEAAGRQGKFWEMHDIIFENQRSLEDASIIRYAESIDLDMKRFEHDIQQKANIDKVHNDFESGMRSGVNRTPTFFINGKKYDGDWEGEALLQYLKTLLMDTSIKQA